MLQQCTENGWAEVCIARFDILGYGIFHNALDDSFIIDFVFSAGCIDWWFAWSDLCSEWRVSEWFVNDSHPWSQCNHHHQYDSHFYFAFYFAFAFAFAFALLTTVKQDNFSDVNTFICRKKIDHVKADLSSKWEYTCWPLNKALCFSRVDRVGPVIDKIHFRIFPVDAFT